MAHSKPKRKRKPQPSARCRSVSRWRVIPHAGGPDDETGVFFPDFLCAADYCLDHDIPYLFEEDVSGSRETITWIVGIVGDNISMTAMPYGDFLSTFVVHPFHCPQCNSYHPFPV